MRTEPSPFPLVSVVIPMRNEAAHIGLCLDALLAQDYPGDRLEVIVADGRSTDGSDLIVADRARAHRQLRVCDNPATTTPQGLNTGIRDARGEVIIILGSRATVAPDFVRESVLALDRSGADVAGGITETNGDSDFGLAVAEAQASRFGVGGVSFRVSTEEGFVDTAPYAAYRRAILERVGLFDEEMVRDQDDELNYRIRELGGRIFFTPRVRSRYVSRPSARRLWTQYYQYGYYKVRVLQKHPRTMQARHFVPPAAVGLGLVGVGAVPFLRWKAVLAGAPLAAAYSACTVVASARAIPRIGWRRLPALALTFPILHASYGSGFLVGLVRFRRNWTKPEPDPPALAPLTQTAHPS